jgi:endonuclease/exonuclease/phosphatase family metal-dependent hydrolase
MQHNSPRTKASRDRVARLARLAVLLTAILGLQTSGPFAQAPDGRPTRTAGPQRDAVPAREPADRVAVPRRPVPPPQAPVVTSPASRLPPGWSTRDVGAPALPGDAVHATGQFVVTGEGPDIWGTADGFRFVYRSLTGDGEIVARVESLQHVDDWSKAGVMMREALGHGSRHATMLTSAANGLAFQRRPVIGGTSLHTNGGPGRAPQFVRLTRSGSTFHAWRSDDGMSWVHVGSERIPMAQTIHVGLVVSSHQRHVPALATFTHVSVQAGPTAAPAPPAPSAPAPAPAPTPPTSPAPAPPESPAPAPTPPAPTPPAPAPPPADPASSSGGTTLRVLHWNIQHGMGMDGRYDLERQATWMADMRPDVISLNEVERFSSAWGNEDQPARLAALLQQKTGHHWYRHFAHRSGEWSANGQGNLILSRFPLTSTDELRLSCNRSAALAGFLVNGRIITIASTHLDLDSNCRTTQVSQLLAWFRYHPEQRILAGDWNDQASSSPVTTVTETYHDAWARAEAAGTATDYPGNSRFGATRNSRIDYIFYSKQASRLVLQSARVYDTRDAHGHMASDHKPLVVTFEVR